LTSAETSGLVWPFMATLEHHGSQVALTYEPLVEDVSCDEVEPSLATGCLQLADDEAGEPYG
jgi:hypothetical protein